MLSGCAYGVCDCAGPSLGHRSALCLIGEPQRRCFLHLPLSKTGIIFPGSLELFLEPRGNSARYVCFWYTGQENLYILAFSEGNSLVQSQQQTAAEHTDMLKYLEVKCSYRLIQMRIF